MTTASSVSTARFCSSLTPAWPHMASRLPLVDQPLPFDDIVAQSTSLKTMKIIGLFGLFITTSLGVAATDYNTWVKHFYQTQDVSSFDGYWQMVLHAKMLENRNQVNPVLGFARECLQNQ